MPFPDAGANVSNVKRPEWKMDHKNATANADGPIHDGERVRLELQSKDMTQADFADGMNWQPSQVSRMLRQKSWKTADLALAGKILDCDFFQNYRSSTGSRTTTILVPVRISVPEGLEIKGIGDLESYFNPEARPPDR
jgi:transcriptional regulator with XRE-family HTH domain